jgi:crossover junction endodeoxyribonuclease RuvC
MVCVLLNLPCAPQTDAADALAIALCHSYRQHALRRVSGARGLRAGRLR